ncbi:hypothetical protein TeGR_g5516, partial [Tetraparma gracilis]
IASSSSHSADKPLGNVTLGCVFKAPVGLLKGKFTSDGVVEACLTKSVAKGVTVNPAFRVSAHKPADTFNYGLGVTMS